MNDSNRGWKEHLDSRLGTAEQAVASIQRGRCILIGSGAAEPTRLVEAMVEHGDHLADNQVVHLLTLGPAPYVRPGLEHRFRHTAFFIGANVRQAVHEGRADFMPVFLSEIPHLIRSRRVRVDVAMIQVSAPDDHGYVSLGVSVDIVRAAVDAADLVLAEINPNMPRTHGDSFLHVNRIAHLVPVDDPLPELARKELDEVSRRIGRNVASLVPDGATLQVGIGKIPDAVLGALTERHALGVHTEMLSDGTMDLVEAGVIDGRHKTLLPGKLVTSFIMGTRRLYDWVDGNPAIEMRPSDFTNDPLVVARNDGMIAINSALAVDLTGQVAADTLMGRFFSGIGGQVDFIRGAARSRGGKAVIALPSTAQAGTVGRIVPALEEGAGVVTSRGDVQYVVTEYGVADLWGKSVRQRALALIEIAHPDHRAELFSDSKRRRYVFGESNVARNPYPWEEQRTERLPAGATVTVRPVRITDEETLRDLFYRLSDPSTRQRFLAGENHDPHERMRRLVDFDYEQNMALVACVVEHGHETLIGMSRYDVDPATRLADLAIVVREEWRTAGVGTLLINRTIEIARARGLAGLCADVPATHKSLLAILHKSGLTIASEPREGALHVTALFPELTGTD